MKTWYDIVQEVRIPFFHDRLQILFEKGGFHMAIMKLVLKHDIKDIISNCLNDPDVYFIKKEKDSNGNSYLVELYKNDDKIMHGTEYNSTGCLVKSSIDLPENAVDIFWNELMYEPYQSIDVFKKHYVLLAHAMEYDQYGSVEFLHNIFTIIEMKEVDARFKEALSEMSKKDITCIGCREEQPNQEAHMGEGGCIQE